MSRHKKVGETSLRRLQAMDPLEFEHFVATLWDRQGWETEVTTASNDYGVDVKAEKDDGMVRQTAAIQAKRYADRNTVGRDEVQQYHAIRTQDPDVDTAIVVTTSSFTNPAEEWAENHGVRLVNGDDLLKKLREFDDAEELIEEYTDTVPEQQGFPEVSDEETDELTMRFLGAMGGGFLLLIAAFNLPMPSVFRIAIAILGLLILISPFAWATWMWYDITKKEHEVEQLTENQ